MTKPPAPSSTAEGGGGGSRQGRETEGASPKGTSPWPTELRFNKSRAELLIRFDDGHEATIPYELLRVESPSAETKGHGGDRPPPPSKKRKVGVIGAEPVGRYALRIRFDDGHDTGIYTWTYLRELGAEKTSRMAAYLGRLNELGLQRE